MAPYRLRETFVFNWIFLFSVYYKTKTRASRSFLRLGSK